MPQTNSSICDVSAFFSMSMFLCVDAFIICDVFRLFILFQVARACISAGANMINDISGGVDDPMMYETISQLGCTYIIMHTRGKPKTMSSKTYTNYQHVVRYAYVHTFIFIYSSSLYPSLISELLVNHI